MKVKLMALYIQPTSQKEEAREVEIDLNDVISYGHNGDGTYSMHTHTRFGDTELIKITHSSFIYLIEMMEDYHNPNKFGSKMV